MSAKTQAKELNRAAEAAVEIELVNCKNSCEHFIDRYVHIFDRDVPGAVIKLEMWAGQRSVIKTFLRHRLTIILKARQLGLTWLALSYAVRNLLFNSGYMAVGLSKGDIEAMELVERISFILRHLPSWMVMDAKDVPKGWAGITYEITAHEVVIHFPANVDGKFPEDSKFQAFAASPDSGRSFTANLVIIDEWAYQVNAEAIWTASYPTINSPAGNRQVIGLSSGKRGTWFEFVWNKAKAKINSFYPVFLPWMTDPRRTQKWHENTKKNLPNTYKQEYPETESDAFAVGQGAFFEEWDESVHVVPRWEPPNDRSWYIVGAYDPGYSSFAPFKWYAVSPYGWIRGFREYYPHRVTDAEQAKEIKKRSVYKDGSPMHFYYIVADSDAWTPSRDSGKSTAVIFAEHGLAMRQADKNLSNGWRRLHEWLLPFPGKDGKMTALLTFTKDCANTIRTYPSCEQSKTNPEDIALSSESHMEDIDRYMVMSRPMPLSEESRESHGSFDEDNKKKSSVKNSPYD